METVLELINLIEKSTFFLSLVMVILSIIGITLTKKKKKLRLFWIILFFIGALLLFISAVVLIAPPYRPIPPF